MSLAHRIHSFQVFVQLYGLVTILLLIGTTRNFQIGAWRKVSRQFRGAIVANVSYVLITIALVYNEINTNYIRNLTSLQHIVTHRKYEHFLLRLAISLAQKASKNLINQSKNQSHDQQWLYCITLVA